MLAGNGFAAEGVTLSGAGIGEDCRLTELWRIPRVWVPKVQGGLYTANLSGKRTKSVFVVLLY